MPAGRRRSRTAAWVRVPGRPAGLISISRYRSPGPVYSTRAPVPAPTFRTTEPVPEGSKVCVCIDPPLWTVTSGLSRVNGGGARRQRRAPPPWTQDGLSKPSYGTPRYGNVDRYGDVTLAGVSPSVTTLAAASGVNVLSTNGYVAPATARDRKS